MFLVMKFRLYVLLIKKSNVSITLKIIKNIGTVKSTVAFATDSQWGGITLNKQQFSL